MADKLLKEDGDLLLLETGSGIELEAEGGGGSVPFVNNSRFAYRATLPLATVPQAADDVPWKIRITGDTEILPWLNSTASNLIVTDAAGDALPFDAGVSRIAERGELGWSLAQFGNARAIGDLRVLGYYDLANADWRVGAWDVEAETWTSTKLADTPAGQKDDHNNPSITYDSAGYIYAFCAEHHVPRLRVFKSNSPNSIAAFTQVANLDSFATTQKSYAMSECFRDFGDLLVLSWRGFTGGVTGRRYISFSDDGGTSWSTPVIMIEETSERPYPQMIGDQSNGRLHVFFTPGGWTEIADNTGSIYHFYVDCAAVTKTLHLMDDTLVGNLGSVIMNSSNAMLVDDASVRGFYMWPADCDLDANGNPCCVHSEINSASPNFPFDLRIRYAHWDFDEWASSEVMAEGQSIQAQSIQPSGGYFRGAALLNDSKLFVFADDANKRLRGYKLTTNTKEDWQIEATFTPYSDAHRCVPFRGASGSDPCQMAYIVGPYKDYQYNTGTYNGIPAGTQPRQMCDIALWPLAGVEADIAIVTEVDTDGVNDTVAYVQAGGIASVPTAPFSGALLAMHGENGGTRVSSSNTLMNGLTACTVLAAFKLRGADTQPKTFASDFGTNGGDVTNTHILFRIGTSANSRRLETFWYGPSSTSATRNSTTLNATLDQYSAAASRFNGTANLALALDGVLDTAGTSAISALNTAASAHPLRLGETLHSANMWFDGWLESWLVFNTAKTDAWLQAATIAMRGDQHTLSAPELVTPAGGGRPISIGGPCIGAIDE